MTGLRRHWPALLVAGLSGWMVWLAGQPGAAATIGTSDPAWPQNWAWAGLGPDLLAILTVLALAVWADHRIGQIGRAARAGLWMLAGGFAANGVGAGASGLLAHVPAGTAVDVWLQSWPWWWPANNPADFAAGAGVLLLTGSLVSYLAARWCRRAWSTAAVAAVTALAAVGIAAALDVTVRGVELASWVEATSRFHR